MLLDPDFLHVRQVSLRHGRVFESERQVIDQVIDVAVAIDLDEVVVELSDDAKGDKIEHERVSASLCNIGKVPQVDNLDKHDHHGIDETHQKGSALVLKILWMQTNILHHGQSIADLSLKLKVEKNGTDELDHNNCLVLKLRLLITRLLLLSSIFLLLVL